MDDDQPKRRGFARAARAISHWTGSPAAAAVLAVAAVAWFIAGVATGYPRAWELVATVGVPLLTLAVLIGVQHTQDHDDLAMQLKMDEIIRVLGGTRERMMNVEEEDRNELERLQIRYRRKDSA
jgi:low affinity Fe/Cu permease